MKTKMNIKKICLHLPLLALLTVFANAQTVTTPHVVFADNFDYSGWNSGANPMNSVWTNVANTPALRTGEGLWPESYVRLNNSTIFTEVSNAVTGDFSLTVTMFSESYGRSNWFAITDATGANGYYVRWDGGAANQFDGQGRVNIGKISSAITGYQTNPGAALVTPISSGHLAAGDNTVLFATVTLTWVSNSNMLELWVDGVKKQEIVDASFASFSRIYLSGNANGLYGSVALSTIPEPSSVTALLAVLSLGCCAFVKFRRRRVA